MSSAETILSRRRVGPLLACLVLIGACTAGPDLRPIDQPVSVPSLEEGRRLLERGRGAEAVTVFRQLLRKGGADLQALNGLAIAYSELGRPDLAAEMFAKALAEAPDDPATLNNVGFAALRRADARLARHYLERARANDPDLAEVKGNLSGLDRLESMERTHLSSRSLIDAALGPSGLQAARIRYLSVTRTDDPERRSEQALTGQPEETPFTPPPLTMIDFTAVNDPFSNDRAVE